LHSQDDTSAIAASAKARKHLLTDKA